jgi:hypothetical protein
MLNKYKFITIMEGEFCKIINVNVVSQCNGCHHIVLTVFRKLTFISGKLTKTESKLLLTFNIVNILISNMRGVQFS